LTTPPLLTSRRAPRCQQQIQRAALETYAVPPLLMLAPIRSGDEDSKLPETTVVLLARPPKDGLEAVGITGATRLPPKICWLPPQSPSPVATLRQNLLQSA